MVFKDELMWKATVNKQSGSMSVTFLQFFFFLKETKTNIY